MLLSALLVVLLSSPAQSMPEGPARVGWEAIQRGDGEKAAAAFREALTNNPRDPGLLTGAAIAAHLLGRDDQAMSSLKRAIELAPENAYAHYLLGEVAYSQGDLDLAIKSLEKVTQIAPGSPGVSQRLDAWKKEASLHSGFTTQPGVRFTILFEGPDQQAIASRVSATLEAAYVRVGTALNTYPSQTITVILYSREQFRDVTHAPGWAAGAYDGRIRIPVLGALRSPAELDRIVTHEFVHAVIESAAPRGIPVWLNEGLATYFEPTDHTWLRQRLRTAPGAIPLSKLEENFAELTGDDALLAYAESWVAARVLVERLGANFPVFLQYVGSGTSVKDALLLFNVTDADIERQWTRRTSAAVR